MKQLDLIVTALKEYTEIVATAGTDYRVCCGADIDLDGHLDDCLAVKALAAAKELKDNLNLEQFAAFVRSTKVPITTADCKKFLVAEITQHPEIVTSIYDGFNSPDSLLPTALQERKWVRTEKFKPTGEHYRVQDEYFPLAPESPMIPAARLSTIRVFHLDPDQFDDSVGFMIYEDKQGNLILGEYVGD